MITDKEKIQLERDFISLLLKHKDLIADWIESGPDIGFFDSNLHMLLYAIVFAFNNNSLLTLRAFRVYLSDKIADKLEIIAHEKEYNLANMSYVKRDDFYIIKAKITEAYISRSSIDAIEKFRQDVNNSGSLFAIKKLNNTISELVTNSDIKKPVIYQSLDDYMPEFVELLESRKDENSNTIIRCGIKEIDSAMVGGFAPGTLTLFCSDVGGFKSTMMLNIGLNIWAKGHNVLFVPLEMPRDKMTEKLVSRETGISFEKFECTYKMTEDDWKKITAFEKDRKKWSHKFYIMDAPERTQVSLIRREIEKHVDIFKPVVVIVDYIANLVPEGRYVNERNDLQIGEMLKDLRHMGRRNSITDNGFAVISAAQIGREGLRRLRKLGAGKSSFYSEDLRGSHEYSMIADYIFGQMEDVNNPSSNLIMLAIKCRYGSKSFGGKSKAVLDIKPDISLIQSKDDAWLASEKQQSNVLEKVNADDSQWEGLDFDSSTDLGF